MQEMQEARVQSLGLEVPLEEEMATQYSCLENSMDRGAWQATVHGVAESQTRLSIHKLTLSLVLSRLTLLCDSSQSLQSCCFPLLYVVSMCGAGIRLLPLTPSTL